MPSSLPEALPLAVPAETLGQARPRVVIVILNWNGREVLRDCLRTVCALSYPAVETIVVDNGSSDGSVQMVHREFPNCLVIENPVNRGFSAGNNQGIRLALERGSDYVLVLNNDTLLDPECLSRLVGRAESDPRFAAVSPKIYFVDPPGQIWFAGGSFSYWKGRNGHIGYRQCDSPEWNVPREVTFLSGCALLVSARVWQELGGFDEALFRSGEDADWSLRAQKAGYRLFYEPEAVLWHHESFDIQRNDGQAGQMYFYTRNSLVVMWKHGRWWHWLTFLPYHMALSCKRIVQAISRNDWPAVVEIAKGFRDFPALARHAKSQQRTGIGFV